MTAFTSKGELTRESLTDAPDGAWLDAFLESYNDLRRSTQAVLQKGISTADNTINAEKTLSLVNNVEVPCANPLNVPVKGVIPVQCEGLALDSTGKQTGAVYALGMPTISWRPNPLSKDGGVLIKATYPPPQGYLRLAKSVDQTGVASSANTAVTFDVHRLDSGDAFTHSTTSLTTRVVCNYAGVVRFSASIAWSSRTPVAGDGVSSWVAADGITAVAGSRFGVIRVGAANDSFDVIASNDEITVGVGSYIELYGRQYNAAAAARSIMSNATLETTIGVRYVASGLTTTGRVNLLFYGG